MTNPQFPERYDRNEMPYFVKDMRDIIKSDNETMVFDIDDSYKYVVTNDQELKKFIRNTEEAHIFREANDHIAIPASQALICRVPEEMEVM